MQYILLIRFVKILLGKHMLLVKERVVSDFNV